MTTSQIHEISMAASRAGVFNETLDPQTLQAIGDFHFVRDWYALGSANNLMSSLKLTTLTDLTKFTAVPRAGVRQHTPNAQKKTPPNEKPQIHDRQVHKPDKAQIPVQFSEMPRFE